MRRNLVSSAVLAASLIFLATADAAEVSVAPGASESLQLGVSASLGKAAGSKAGVGLALASTDVSGDGFPDLISASATDAGGEIAWHRGNPEAWAPSTPASLALVKAGQFPVGFVANPVLIALPIRPDFVAAGDFDADGHGDVVVAQRGSGTIYLLAGSKAGLSAPRALKLVGGVDAMASGQIDRPDGQMDLAVAVSNGAGASLLTFTAGLDVAPQRTALRAAVSDLAIGNLDDSPAGDVALLSGGKLSIWHGSLTNAAIKNRVESLTFDFLIEAMALGNFIWDRAGYAEVALLKDDGTVQFAGYGALDTRPFTQAEIRAKRRAQIEGEPSAPRGWKAGQSSNWRIVEATPSLLAKSSAAGGAFLQSARLSGGQSDDLLVGDRLNQSLTVLTREGVARKRSELSLDKAPIALLTLQNSAFVRPSLVLLQSGAASPVVVPAVAKATFSVTKTADTNDGACNADCSLREAIVAANAAAGADNITLPAGTYTLTIANTGGANEDASAQGDLDINDALTISGAGAATTIVQAGTTNANGIDKVFAFNPFCSTAVSSSMSGVTVRFGRNTQPNTNGTGDFSETGGGIDVCNTGSGGFSASNIVVTDNSVANSYGGGINLDSVAPANGTYTITGSTISNNRTTSAASILKNGGGLNLFADANTVTLTNNTISGNSSANEGGGIYVRHTNGGAITLSGVTISNNTAASRGGGVSNSNFGASSLTINNDSFVLNNTSQGTAAGFESRGGGIFVFSPTTTLIRETTITGNSANTGIFQGGGGIAAISGTITAQFNRIAGNSAGTGGGSGFHNDGATVTGARNWWGCNSGPTLAPCDQVTIVSGIVSTTPHIVLRNTASPTSIAVGQTSTLTADFLTDSAAGAIAVSDLDALIGTAHAFSGAVLGTISAAQTSIQAPATATATFTGAAPGSGSVNSVVDAQTQTVSITITKANTSTTITADSPDPSNLGASVTVAYTVAVSAPGAGTPTGNVVVTISGGAETCTGTVAAGSCALTLNAGGARTITASYVGDGNFNASAGTEAHTVTVCPATVVTNGNDSGSGSLRDIVANACPASTVSFQAGVTTISLTTAELSINKNLTINGGTGVTVTRSAAGGTPNFRIFNVQAGNAVSMSNLTVSNGNHPAQAGGILNGGSLTLNNTQISGNRAPQGAGIQNEGVLIFSNGSIVNNVATSFGAGLLIFGSSTTLSNCTISGNSGGSDSGGIGAAGTVSITNCSIVGNQTAGAGSGIVVNAAFLTLRNSIVALNVGTSSSSPSDIDGNVQTGSAFNVLGAGGSGGLTNGVNNNQVGVGAGALLVGTLGSYGGPTSTLPLLPGSVAINAATNASAPVVDQRGIARPQVGSFDVGAFESRGFNVAIGGGNTQTAVVNTAFATPLSVAVSPVAVGEPVQGGTVSFIAPGSGASASLSSSPATIGGTGVASVVATANGTTGSYSVAANTSGNTGSALSFALQNRALSADLSITKTDGVTTAVPGGSVTYTITASNAGPDPVGAATVADTFPAALTCTWTCVGVGGGTCAAAGSGNINEFVGLPVGGSVSHTASCSISAAATGTLSNTATVSSAISDPSNANNSATDADTLTPQANIGITKTDGVTTVFAGGGTTYTITSGNVGPSNAPSAIVTDTFPASLTCTWTCVGAGGGTCTAAGAGNINDTVNLPSGASVTHTASCSISAAASGTLSNTATVAAGVGITDPVSGNNSATDSDTVQVVGLSIDDVTANEGNAGTTSFTFTVSLSTPAGPGGASFDVATANGTAIAGTDYVANSLTGQTIAAGASTYSFTVLVNGDTLNEPAETFFVNVTNVVGATVVDGQGLGTITNDDALPSFAINDVTVIEGNAGTVNAVFTVTLDAASGQSSTVNYATADGTAIQPADYTSNAGTVTFTPGQTTRTINVLVVGDTVPEANETFFVNLSGATNATISDNQGLGTINNDDSPSASISVSPASVTEDGAANLVYTVALTVPAITATTVNLSSAGTATTGTDFTGALSSVLIPIGASNATVIIDPTADAVVEADETVIISVLAGVDYTVGAASSATGTITNDDVRGITVIESGGNTAVTEGGATDSFTVVLTSQPEANVQIALDGGTQVTAAPTPLTFTSANWNVAQTVTVTAIDDTLFENNPHTGSVSFTVTSTDAGYNAFAVPAVAVSVTDDDAAPTINISSPSQPEGNTGTSVMNFVVSLSAPSGLTVTLTRATADGSATVANSDYVPLAAAPASIPAGQTSLTIPVTINGDTVFEGDEAFSLILSAITNATPSPTISGTGTITDDDQQPTTTTITSDLPDPSVVGQPYTVVVQVAASSSSPLGTVSISDGTGGLCGPITLVAGTSPNSTASCAVTSTSIGAKTLTATYTPASTAFAAGTGTTAHQVSAAATTISVTGPARSRINQPTSFSFTLAVTAPGGGTPTGTVTLSSGASSCVVTLPSTSCNLSFSALGSRSIRASYAGTANYSASTSSGAGDAQTLVFALADLQVSKTDGVDIFQPGDLIVYTVQLRNLGPDAAANLRLRDALPAALPNVLWSCDSSGGTTCPQSSGSGDLDALIAVFPVGGLLNYTFYANVEGSPPELVNTALMELPADTTIEDPVLSNNSATDINRQTLIFANGFEELAINASSGNYRMPSLALRGVLDDVARAALVLSDAEGEALRVYARVWDGEVQYALALRDSSGALKLAAWRAYDGEPLLSWTTRSVDNGWVIESVEFR